MNRTCSKTLSSLVLSLVLAGGSMAGYASPTCAQGSPNLTIKLLGASVSGKTWSDNTVVKAGDQVQLYIEVHNTVVGTTVNNTNVRVSLPTNESSNLTITAYTSGSNHPQVSDVTNVTVQGGTAKLVYKPQTTFLTWDYTGDGLLDYNMSKWPGDDLHTTGVNFSDLKGCNEFVMQLGMLLDVVGVAALPSPTPSPTPAPQDGVTQTQSQTQTVNVTTVAAATPAPSASPAPQVVRRVLPATGPTREQIVAAGLILLMITTGMYLRRWARR